MISLQQIEISQYCPEEQSTVAIHRRSSTVLSLHSSSQSIFTSRQSGGNRVWAVTGSFKLPSSQHIIGFYNLEAYNAFMVLFEYNSSTRAYFLDLTCNLINKWDLDNSCNGLVAGYDQNRKDLILAAKNGDVKAFTVRLVKSIIHVIYRSQVRIPRAGRSAPIQIATQDVPGTFLILTVNGGISCWETSQLECLWRIDATRFRLIPTKIFADKFGTDFAVLCVNKQQSNSQLEVWSPPRDYVECGLHRFVRKEIPLKASVVSLSLETIGGDFGTALMVIQNNRHAQLWTLADGDIIQHCDLICTGEVTSFSEWSDLTIPVNERHENLNQEVEFLKTFSLGQGCFTDGFGCPANEVLYLGLSDSDFCLFALHSPTKGDLLWQEAIVQQTMADDMAAQSGAVKSTDRVPIITQFTQQLPATNMTRPKMQMEEEEKEEEKGRVLPTALDEEIQPDGGDDTTVGGTVVSLSDFYGTDDPGALSSSRGQVFAFTPTAAIPSLHEQVPVPNSMVQAIKPRGLVVLSDNKDTSFPQLHRLTRAGMLLLNHPQDVMPVKSELEIDKVSIAHRSERMVCITDIKEGFVFDMKSFNKTSPTSKPIRLEVGISPNAKCTTVVACDVFIRLPPAVLLEEGIKAPLEGPGMMGSHVLALFGDSDGKIYYSLCSHTSVLQQGFIRAHAGPVVAIVSTGDCMRPIWKVGTARLQHNSPQLQPTAMPGSAIVSMDCEGEVKVWQPMFSNSGVLRSKQSQILSIYQLSWYLSGIINTCEPPCVDTISTCCLDPTCTTVYIGFGSGKVQQWVIPGITHSGSNKAQIIRDHVWGSRKHGTSICSMRMWVNLPDTSVKARCVNFSQLNDPKLSKSAKYAAMITDNTNISTSNENHIAYTLEELRKFAENSTFVTAAKDNTIVLWRLFVAKAADLPSDITDLKSQRLFTQCRFLEPIKCQMFTVSAAPTEALCYPLQPQGGVVHWRLSALVNGIIINLAQAEKNVLFLAKAKAKVKQKPSSLLVHVKRKTPDFGDTFKEDDESSAVTLEYDRMDQAIIDNVESMPVICEVLNPQRTVALMSLSGVPCRLSWKHSWQQDDLEIPVQNVFVDGGGEGNAQAENVATQVATLNPSLAHLQPPIRKTFTTSPASPTFTDQLRSPPRQYTVGTSLVTPEKIAIKKVDKDALQKKKEAEAAAMKSKQHGACRTFKNAASKPLPTDTQNVHHAGVRMRVPTSNLEHLDQITPGNHAKKYYAPKNMTIGASAVKESNATSTTHSFAGNFAPNIQPPSPPTGGVPPLAMTIESPPGSRGHISIVRSEVLNVEGHSSCYTPNLNANTNTSPTQIVSTIPSGRMETSLNDDDSVTDSTLDNDNDNIVDMNTITNDYLQLLGHDVASRKNDPLTNPIRKSANTNSSKPAERSHVATSIKQPYRSSHLGSVPGPRTELRKGEYKKTRFLATDEPQDSTIPHIDAMNDSFAMTEENLKFKMFVNPVDQMDVTNSIRTTNRNLHSFRTKKDVEEFAQNYSYFQNPRNYYEKLTEPKFYKADPKSKADEAKELRSLLEEEKENAMMSDLDSDASGDEDSDMDAEKIQKIKDSMLSSELKLFSSMTKAEQKAFLIKKRKENQKLMRQSKAAFQELAGFELAGVKAAPSREEGGSDDDERDEEDEERAEAARAEAALRTKITSRKVLGWGSVKKAVNVGITMKVIKELISDSSKRKKNGNNPPANMNMKEFTTFAKKLNQAIAENEIPPHVETIIVDTLHDRVDISIQGTKLGRALIVVMEDTPDTAATIPIATDYRNLDTLLFRYEGVVSVTDEPILHTDKAFLTLKNLDPSTKYKLIVCGQHNDGTVPCRSTNDQIRDSVVRFKTEEAPEENMDIEWGRLSNEQKCDELVAAISDLDTQAKVANAGLVIPSADDMEGWLAVVEETTDPRDLAAEELDDEGQKSSYGLVKLFVDWWTNNDAEFGHSSHRSDFLSREAKFQVQDIDLIHQCTDEQYLTIEQSELIKKTVEDKGDVTQLPEYLTFRSWWKGGRVMEASYLSLKRAHRLEQFAELRKELLEREDVAINHQDSSFVEFSDEELSFNEGEEIKDTFEFKEGDEEEDEDEKSATITGEDMGLMRSQHSGGVVSPQRQNSACSSKGVKALDKVIVDDLIYVDDFDEEDPRAVRLQDRSERLEELAQKVEDSITLVNGLLMAQKHAEEEDLSIDDLERRRGLLRYEDVITIMAMKKLKELCDSKQIRPRDLTEANIQKVTGASTFVLVEEADLTPDEPPQATMLSLIGNAKRPMRNWDNMTPPERVLEMQLACMLIDISELAVESGISVPNPEDGNILSHSLVIPVRIKRWTNYEQWYVGNETSDNPKKQRPSLARIMFADWEKKSVKKDADFHEILKKRLTAASSKKLIVADSEGGSGEKAIPPKLSRANRRLSSKRMSSANMDTHKLSSYKRSNSGVENEDDEIVRTYESVINKDANIRCRYLTKLLEVVMKSRNLGVMRLLLPPAWPGRMHSNFMFPRLGLITPCYTEPVERFQPNPSFSTESYSVAEVMLWFSMAELDLDDQRMKEAEVEGKKHQKYLEWLAEEESRMLAGRILMRREDFYSHHLRHHTSLIEADIPPIDGDSGYKDFIHGPSLNGHYESLQENVRYFEGKGCGIDNEDEVADVLEQMRYEAESAIRAKREMKKIMIEERKRKEEEEKKRLENIERDNRIAENKDRLIQLRRHLENLKESRLQEKAAKELAEREAILQQERRAQEELEEKEQLKIIRMEQAKVDHEIEQMTREDEVHHIQRDHLREFASMEHEDICGLMMREKQLAAEAVRLEKIKELKAVYEEFAPFVFKKSQIRVPHLHIDDEPEEESKIILPEKIDWKMLKGSATGVSHRGTEDDGASAGKKEKGTVTKKTEKYDINSVFFGNERNDEILEELFSSDWNSANKFTEALFETGEDRSPDINAQKYWPRSTFSPPIATPLVWKGPDPKNDKPKQLRKKERPYTQFNSSEPYLQKVLKVSDTNKIVFVETSVDNTLHAVGLGKELIRSLGQKDREDLVTLPPLHVKQPTVNPSQRQGGRGHSTSMASTLRVSSPKTSFVDPVIFHPSPEGLSIHSPSAKNIISEYMHPDVRQGHQLVQSKTVSIISNTYRVKTPKGKKKKEGTKSISSEKTALKDFIKKTSLASLDPFYLEACRPGLRDSDSLSKKKQLSELKLSKSMPIFKKEVEEEKVDSDVGGVDDGSMNDDGSVTDSIDGDSVHGPDLQLGKLDQDSDGYNSSNYNTARSENRMVLEMQKSLAESTSRNNTPMKTAAQEQDFEDDLSFSSPPPQFPMDDIEFRITDRNVTYQATHKSKGGSEYQRHEEYKPPFYRKPFGVKGHVKPIEEESFIVRARKSAEAIKAQKEKEERIEARKLMKKSKEEQKQQSKELKKQHAYGTTVKSLHRDEFAALLRKSFEETSRQYDCGNVNFKNNKGL